MLTVVLGNVTTNEETSAGTEDPAETLKKLRNLRKKLVQISQLEEKLKSGVQLDSEQQLKLSSKQKLTGNLVIFSVTSKQNAFRRINLYGNYK